MKSTQAILLTLLVFFAGVGEAAAQTAAERSVLLVRQGAAALLRGKYDRAIQAYDQALEYDKLAPANKANILSDRGVAHWRMNQSEQALVDFNQAIELNPQYPQVYNNMGNVLIDLNRHQEAVAAYSKAIEFAPTYGVAYSNRASAEFELGDIKGALNDFDAAVRYLSLNAVPHNGRGRAFLSSNRNYAALRDFSRAVKLNKSYGMVFLSRARANGNIRDYREAIKDYSEAINIAHEEPQLYFERAQAYQAASDYGPAITDYSKVIDLAPGNAEAYAQRGLCYGLNRSFDKAMVDVDKAIELDPASVNGYLARAKVLKRKGDLDRAVVDLNTVLELSKEHAEALKLMGQISEIRNAKDEAIAFYLRSVAADPFMDGSREGLKRLTDNLPPYATQTVGEPVSGWKLARLANGQYFISNDAYPFLYSILEMYGEGEPKLVEWVPLTGEWKGIGELRYEAGTRDEDGTPIPLVYSAIVDLKNNKLAAIEPFSWGDRTSKWRWGNGSVVVTDPDGMASEVPLRRPSANMRSGEDDVVAEAMPWPDVTQPARRGTRRPPDGGPSYLPTQSQQPRRPSKSIFDWLFP